MSDGAEPSAPAAVTHDHPDGFAPSGQNQDHLPRTAATPFTDAAAGECLFSGDAASDRISADREQVDAHAAGGFAGPGYDRLEDRLAKYGLSVLGAWMRSGYVFHAAARRGYAVSPTEGELADLHRDPDLREELALMVVAVALRRFREEALVGGGWRADGGASLATYFIGACLSAFPNEFRKLRGDRRRWRAQDAAGPATATEHDRSADPSDEVLGTMHVRQELAGMDPRTQVIVALRMDGYTHEEIAEMLDETSARAVEGVLYRLRSRQLRRIREGGE